MLKVGGNEIGDPFFLGKLSDLVVQIRSAGHKLVLVHGGGKEITGLLERLGIETKFVDGLRYTDPATLEAVEMVLSGTINKRIVKALIRKGVESIGLSGVDGKILVAERITRKNKDIGLVGNVTDVNVNILTAMMEKLVVVLSPLAMDRSCVVTLNVNADYAAAAVGSSLRAELIIFLSNVPGVLRDGAIIPEVNEMSFNKLKDDGIVSAGMIPKIEAALAALKGGTLKAVVTDGDGAAKVVSGLTGGTEIIA